jgi:hypothetical protein
VQDENTPPADRVALALDLLGQPPGFVLISGGEPRQLGGRETVRFSYKIHEGGIGPAIVFNHAFNDGGSGWRTRAAVATSEDEARRLALDISAHMAETLLAR